MSLQYKLCHQSEAPMCMWWALQMVGEGGLGCMTNQQALGGTGQGSCPLNKEGEGQLSSVFVPGTVWDSLNPSSYLSPQNLILFSSFTDEKTEDWQRSRLLKVKIGGRSEIWIPIYKLWGSKIRTTLRAMGHWTWKGPDDLSNLLLFLRPREKWLNWGHPVGQ